MLLFRREHILSLASIAILAVLMFLFSLHTLTSVYQDIGRHITVGRIIWETGSIPSTNYFSYTNPDFPFVNHHWFGGLLLYWSDRLVGLAGLIMIKAFLVALAFGLALAAAWRPRIALPAIVIGLASVFTMVERTDVRPEIFSFVFLGWFLFVLYRHPSSRLLWTLPVIQLVWVNTHIYFFMGPFLWLVFLTGKVFSAPNIKSGLRSLFAIRYTLFTVGIAFATFMNPSGYRGAFYPLTIWSNYGYSIVENKSFFFLRAYGYFPLTTVALAITLALAIATFIINRKNFRRNIDGGILLAVTGALALAMVRNYPLAALCVLSVSLRNLDQAGWRWSPNRLLGGGVALAVLLGVATVTNQIYDQASLSSRRFGLQVPNGFQRPVEFFRQAEIRGPIFNNFDVGSFLIWKLSEEPVFIDGRPEAYPADFIRNIYIPMQEDETVWRTQSERYHINAIFWNYNDITPWSQAFVKRITRDPQWVPVYHDKGIMILVKDAPQNAVIISKYRPK